MERKIITILIVAKDTKLLDRLVWETRQIFPRQIQILKETKIKSASDIIRRGKADIFVIGTKLSDGNGEGLIELAHELYPEHPIIVYLDNGEDVHYQLYLYDKYQIIKCITRDKLFEEFEKPLRRAKEITDKLTHRRVVFRNLNERIIVDKNEVCYITPEGGNRIHAKIYDWKSEAFRSASRKMSMTGFMKEYNISGDFIRCHASYIVNVYMIEKIDKSGGYLVLIPRKQNGDEIQIPISDTYRADVLTQLQGVY